MGKVKMLWVVGAIVVAALLMLIVGLAIRPDDAKQPTGVPALTSRP